VERAAQFLISHDVLDKLSSGELRAWGCQIVRGVTTTFHSLAPIAPEYWWAARFTYVFLLDDHDRDLHATQHAPSTLPDYADMRVNRENAVKLWPHPLRDRWKVQSITLTARYFNQPAERVTVGCKMITLFDARIETKSDATGWQYQELAAPAYILATGADPVFIRSLAWQPQELSFVDPTTHTERQYMLTGTVEASATNGGVKFFLDSEGLLPTPPISQATLARASAFFADRVNYIETAIDAPAVLRRGAKLLLQVLPTTALDGTRTIDHAAPQIMAHYFRPDGYENADGRPRQEGWVWSQPPQVVAGIPNPVSQWHSRLDWNGFVDIVQVLEEANQQGRVEVVRGYPLERYIVKTLDIISEGYQQLSL
jgi:hypothetical protein